MADTIQVQTGVPVTTTAPTIPDNVKVTDTGAVVTTDASLKPAAPTERPAWHLPNFKTVEDQAKSYAESQRALTKAHQELAEIKKAQAGATTTPTTTSDASAVAGTTPTPAPAASSTQVPPSPLDLSRLSAEWAANGGSLTTASLDQLAKAGISREAVDSYIAGQQAIADKRSEDIANSVGGFERLNSIRDFYKNGIGPKAEADAYNTALAEGRIGDAKIILTAMDKRYTDRVGRDPRVLVKGELASGIAENEKPFSSIQEASRAMANPLYKTDPMYRRSVERRTMAIGR